jgi:hypothetical protein
MSGKKVRLDLTGQTFGRLTVLGYSHTNKHGQSMWLCRCECGNEIIVTGIHLKSGHSQSCRYHANKSTHGMTKKRPYRIWQGMKSRCENPKVKDYKHYGGRGIKVCEEWKNDFQVFYDWAMSHGYSDELTIDRIDVNGNYEPSNCRWATWKEQRANQRKGNVA